MGTSPIDAYLGRLHKRWRGDGSGAVAYIPPLALADRGFETFDAKVGVEPSGEAFNSISLAGDSGRPLNPMINAGAITSASLVAGDSAAARLGRVVESYGRFVGRALAVDEDVYESERATGHRNRAIGHMLRGFGILEEDPEIALDLYFRQCSVTVDCSDLALMAATLANGGVHPVSGERALERRHVDRVLSVMTTCGMYDSAGEWVVDVGMPAKSGVGGEVTIEIEIEGTRRRMATLTPGYSFGEFALADASFRPVTVAAETDGEAMVLSVAEFDRIGAADPALQAALLRNLLAGFHEIIGRMTREVRSLLAGR